ncbi:MAG TPA: PIN domain-containing protein [Candidatus Moranbacteria bacterium]|nr:PIN domain-containing protein [Candidatus Moranbacteria bacterium]
MQNNKMPLYVADTHSLIWYLLDSSKLSSNADQVFQEIENGKAELIIPAIVIAEIIFLVQKGKIQADLDDLLMKIDESENFQVSTLGLNELLCLKEQTEIPEMHDRFIVCETLLKKAITITKDKKIRDSSIVEVVW